jgi:hypothetical protein
MPRSRSQNKKRESIFGRNFYPGNDAPLNRRNDIMSETMQTVVEATKILVKWVVIIAVIFGMINGFQWIYAQNGVGKVEAELYGILTFGIPFAIIIVGTLVWSEAKYRVWKTNKGIE